MKNLEMNNWTNPRTKEVRTYINGWAEALGFEIEKYKSGNISHASYNGEKISNSEAKRNLIGKVYIMGKTLYMDGHADTATITETEKAELIRNLLAEQGIEIENTKYIG